MCLLGALKLYATDEHVCAFVLGSVVNNTEVIEHMDTHTHAHTHKAYNTYNPSLE